MSVQVHSDGEALARAAADIILSEIRAGRRKLLLAGGTTPFRTYQLLAGQAQPADYQGLHVFFSDERAVPPDHPDSNYGMVRRAWLEPAQVPAEQAHRILGEIDPDRAAHLAEEELRRVTGEPAAADLAILGLGADGHTASLFPGASELGETVRLYVPARAGRRISATLPLLNATDRTIFLVSGPGKAEALRTALQGRPGAVPASLVRPRGGAPLWLADRDAASLLS